MRWARRTLIVMGACGAATVGITACGADRTAELRADVETLRRAYLEEDYRTVCAHMTAAAKREVGQLGHATPSSCPRDMAEKLSAAVLSRRDRVDPPIRMVEIDGDRATVVAVLGGTTPSVVRFRREGGVWKLAKLFATTAPPPPDLR